MKGFYIALGLLLFSGCTADFEEINANPNAPEVVAPKFLLTNLLFQTANNNSMEGLLGGNYLAQHTSNLEFTKIDRYDMSSNSALWTANYHLLNDVRSLEELAATGNIAYLGMAKVLRAYLAASLTDLWGDVPYKNAVSGKDGVFAPSYDTQEAVYIGEGGILPSLEQAVQIFEAQAGGLKPEGDILFAGNLDKWTRFANALRIRYLLRVSKRVDVSGQLQSILASGKIMRSNADNAIIPYLSSAPNQWFMFNEREGRYADVRMSTTIEAAFEALNDPRLGVYFKPTEASVTAGMPTFSGIPNGLAAGSQSSYDLRNVSLLGYIVRNVPNGVNALFMRYDEQQFALAEAAQKGIISQGTAKNYYEQGIQAAFQYYGLAVPDGYLERAGVQFETGKELEFIIQQKWMASFLNGYEGWLEFRRTGFPRLVPGKDNVNNNLVPVRFRYPETEQATNTSNYQAAVARIGADNYDSKGWWEK